MGAGKTTVGKLIAKHLNRPFVDSDHEIEKRTGVNIPLIFELEGEAVSEPVKLRLSRNLPDKET